MRHKPEFVDELVSNGGSDQAQSVDEPEVADERAYALLGAEDFSQP